MPNCPRHRRQTLSLGPLALPRRYVLKAPPLARLLFLDCGLVVHECRVNIRIAPIREISEQAVVDAKPGYRGHRASSETRSGPKARFAQNTSSQKTQTRVDDACPS